MPFDSVDEPKMKTNDEPEEKTETPVFDDDYAGHYKMRPTILRLIDSDGLAKSLVSIVHATFLQDTHLSLT